MLFEISLTFSTHLMDDKSLIMINQDPVLLSIHYTVILSLQKRLLVQIARPKFPFQIVP
jgi:hypothetical protein